MDVDVTEQERGKPVASSTPDLTASISPSYEFELAGGARINTIIDYSYRSDLYGEPSSDPCRLTEIVSRELVNFNMTYTLA